MVIKTIPEQWDRTRNKECKLRLSIYLAVYIYIYLERSINPLFNQSSAESKSPSIKYTVSRSPHQYLTYIFSSRYSE